VTDSPRVLIADDQPDILEALRLLLKGEGYRTSTAAAPGAVLALVQREEFDAVLMDMNYDRDTTSGREGLELLPQLLAVDPTLPVIVMTAWGSVDKAVEAMRRGARDFVEKPWDNVRLLATLRTQVELGRALRRGQRLESANHLLQSDGVQPLVASSPAMQPVVRLVERVAPSDANILITGEHGTGKEVLARWIHAASPRAERALVVVNVGGLSEGVFESELFGHVKGAFTDAKADRIGRFEMADGGTLFLDEIGNLSLSQQSRLLRVLQTGEFERVGSSRTRRADVRLLAATNADLRAEVAAGRFREDLLFRLNTIEVHLPPLRDRADDIPELAALFLGRYSSRYRKGSLRFSPDGLAALRAYGWPGNVRELDHVLERAVLMAPGDTVTAADLGLRREAAPTSLDDMTLEEVEAVLIRKALQRHDGNVSLAARDLGLSRSALYRRLGRHGL
jgi:DNA-binding NtrC family response regulator